MQIGSLPLAFFVGVLMWLLCFSKLRKRGFLHRLDVGCLNSAKVVS